MGVSVFLKTLKLFFKVINGFKGFDMSSKFPIKHLYIDNYKCLEKIDFELKRINLIGGDNGTGKSSIVEFLFMVLDRKNPFSIIRPFVTKQVPFPYPDGLKYIFPGGDVNKKPRIEIKISNGNSKDGSFVINCDETHKSINLQRNANIDISHMKNPSSNYTNEKNSIKLTCKIADKVVDEVQFTQIGASDMNHSYNQNVQDENFLQKTFIKAVMITADQFRPTFEMAELLSLIIKKKNINKLIDDLKKFDEDICGIETLIDGSQPSIYITMTNGIKRPVILMGSGFQLLLAIALHINNLDGGLIIFDEIEGAIHYSKQKLFWSILSDLANENNAQVICITHSEEFIKNAYCGVTESHHKQDLKFIRLIKINKTGLVKRVEYDTDEIGMAISQGWEIR